MTETPRRKQSELDREEADKLWSRVTEIDDKLGELDRNVGVMGNKLSSVEAGILNINSTLREMSREASKSSKINWNALGVVVPLLVAFLGMAYWIVHREVEHLGVIADIRHAEAKEFEDIRAEKDYWKITAERAK